MTLSRIIQPNEPTLQQTRGGQKQGETYLKLHRFQVDAVSDVGLQYRQETDELLFRNLRNQRLTVSAYLVTRRNGLCEQ